MNYSKKLLKEIKVIDVATEKVLTEINAEIDKKIASLNQVFMLRNLQFISEMGSFFFLIPSKKRRGNDILDHNETLFQWCCKRWPQFNEISELEELSLKIGEISYKINSIVNKENNP